MAFSPQSYQGQGIVQQNVTPRGGEIIGASLANAGQSIAQGFLDYKRRSGASKGMRTTLEQLGLLTKEEAESMGFNELMEVSRNAPALLQQQTEQQQQAFISGVFDSSQPQMIEEPLVTNQMIEAARQRRNEASMAYSNSLPQLSATTPQDDGPSASFLQQLAPQRAGQGGDYNPDRLPAMSMEDRTAPTSRPTREVGVQAMEEKQAELAARRSQRPQPQAETQPAAPQQAAQPQPNPMLEKLNEAQRELDLLEIRQREGDSTMRPETAEEVNQRFSTALAELAQKYPKASKLAFDMVFDNEDSMTPSERLAYIKYQDEIEARTIPGIGVAPSTDTAKELRMRQTAYEQVNDGVTQLLDMLKIPGRTMNPALRKKAQTIKALLTGALRVPIVGPGAFTDQERELINSVIADPTAIFSLDSRTQTALTTLRDRVRNDRDAYARSIGLTIGAGSRRESFNPSTGEIE